MACVLIVLLGCGRIGFAPTGDGGDDAPDGSRISLELPAGGQMGWLAQAPDGAWYASSETGGSFRSDDHVTWTPCGARYSRGIAVAADNSVWAGGTQIGRSTDRCATWTNTNAPRFANNVQVAGGIVYGLLDNSLVRWNGTGWTNVPTPLDPTVYWSIASAGGVWLAATEDGLLRSTDGMTWTTITAGVPNPPIRKVVLGATRGYLLANGGGPAGIACTNNGGVTWSACDAFGGYTLLVDPMNDQRVLAGIYDDLIVTTDAFMAVTRQLRDDVGLDQASILDLLPAADGSIVLAGDRGVFASPPGSTLAFEPRMTGISAWDIDQMLRVGDDIYVATRGGVLHSTIGQPFTISTSGILWNTNIGGLAALPDGRVLLAGRNLNVTADRGTTWTEVLSLGVEDYYFAPAMTVAGVRAYAGTKTRILVADPPYTTWTPLLVAGATRQVNAVVVVDGTVYAGTEDGLFAAPDGTSFTMLWAETIRAITQLADGGLAIATADGVIMTDSQRTMLATPKLVGRNVTRVREIDTTLVATTDTGVSYSRDRGVTWLPVPGAETMPASDALFDGELVLGANWGLVRVPLP